MSPPNGQLSLVERSYTVAFAARSGSTEICSLLARNGLGAPWEFFQDLALTSSRPASSDANAMEAILSAVAAHTHNGVFGSKMAPNHRARIDGVLRRQIHGYRTIDDLLPNHHWVWLIRRDKIAQAISFCRAEQQGIWATKTGAEQRTADLLFDFYQIMSRIMILFANDLAWQDYFERNHIRPYMVYYEEFFDNLPASLARLVDYLGGLPNGCDPATVDATETLLVQRDDVSAEWTERFRDYLGRIGDMDLASEFGTAHEKWDRFFFGCGWREHTEWTLR